MIVNSFDFIWIFPIVFTIYMVILALRGGESGKIANIFLLLFSYGIYFYYNEVLTLVLFAVTLVTWAGAMISVRHRRAAIAAAGIILTILPLLTFKYYNFLSSNLNLLFSFANIPGHLPGLNWAIPLGISFFTFQAVGYFIDVVKGRIPPERNFFDYMLFVAFFPQIASGPISKASDLLPQIKASRKFDPARVTQGLKWLLWGMFMKVVVADNIGELVTNPIMHSRAYTSLTVIQSVFLYAFQIYCDFAGYSFMAIGIGLILGFELINNFHRPYLAASVTEFWHRWHRSLSIWLRDYVYIPLGGSRCGRIRNYLNIMITFLVSGLWHGANWTFVAWGGTHGIVQVGEKHLGLRKPPSSAWMRGLRIVITFMIVTLAWIFFVHPTFDGAVTTVKSMFSSSGKRTVDFTYVFILAAIVILKDIGDEYDIKALKVLDSRSGVVRWVSYTLIMAAVMILSVYGEKFIYSGF